MNPTATPRTDSLARSLRCDSRTLSPVIHALLEHGRRLERELLKATGGGVAIEIPPEESGDA